MFWKQKNNSGKPSSNLSAESPVRSEKVINAEATSKKYAQLERCCSILSDVDIEQSMGMSLHTGGWRVSGFCIESSGVDIDKVYALIKELTLAKKKEIEESL